MLRTTMQKLNLIVGLTLILLEVQRELIKPYDSPPMVGIVPITAPINDIHRLQREPVRLFAGRYKGG